MGYSQKDSQNWITGRTLLSNLKLRQMLLNYDMYSIKPELVKQVEKAGPIPDPEMVRAKSAACSHLCQWMQNWLIQAQEITRLQAP